MSEVYSNNYIKNNSILKRCSKSRIMNETRTRRSIFMIQPEKVYLLVFFFLSQFALIAQLTIFEEEIKCICDSNSPGEIVLMAAGTAGPFSFHWLGPNNYES